MQSRAATCLLLSLLAACFCQATAGGNEPRQQLERLFADARTTPAVAAAQRQAHDWLRKKYPEDVRIDYAVGLALLGQHRYPDALRYLQRYAEQQPNDAQAAWTYIWTELRLRKYEAAENGCLELAARLGAFSREDARLSAERMGMVFGYLEQTQSQQADEKQFVECKNKVLAALGGAYLESFDEGRQRIISQLGELQTARQSRQEQEDSQRDALLTQTAVNLEANRDAISSNNQVVQQGAEQARDASRQLAVIQTQLRSLGSDRSALSAQIIAIQAQVNSIQAGNTRPANARPGRVDIPVADAVQLFNLSMALGTLNKQAFEMDRRILALRQTAAQLGVQYQQGAQTAGQAQANLEKATKQTQLLEHRAARLEQLTSEDAPPLTARMKSLSTYFDSPVAAEQARVFDWFGGM